MHLITNKVRVKGGGLTHGRGCGVDEVQALVLVAAPLLLYELEGVGSSDLRENELYSRLET